MTPFISGWGDFNTYPPSLQVHLCILVKIITLSSEGLSPPSLSCIRREPFRNSRIPSIRGRRRRSFRTSRAGTLSGCHGTSATGSSPDSRMPERDLRERRTSPQNAGIPPQTVSWPHLVATVTTAYIPNPGIAPSGPTFTFAGRSQSGSSNSALSPRARASRTPSTCFSGA